MPLAELAEKDKKVRVCFLTPFEVRKREFDILFPDVDVELFLTKPLSASLTKHDFYVSHTVSAENGEQ